MKHKTSAFTIVELLVVIVTVGILSSIAVVVFNGVKARGVESLIVSDARANLMRVNQYVAVNGSYPSSAIPISTAEARANDWHMKVSKRSLYNAFYFCGMAKNWGHIQEGVVFYLKTTDGRSYVANTDDERVTEVTDEITADMDVRQLCELGARDGYIVTGIDGLLRFDGGTLRLIYAAP